MKGKTTWYIYNIQQHMHEESPLSTIGRVKGLGKPSRPSRDTTLAIIKIDVTHIFPFVFLPSLQIDLNNVK